MTTTTETRWVCCGENHDELDNYCRRCGKPRPTPADALTEDERLAMLAEALENLHVGTWAPVLEPDEWGGKMVWDCANERGQAAALEFLAKARELLAVEPVALADDEIACIAQDVRTGSASTFDEAVKEGAKAQRARFRPTSLAAPPAQPEAFDSVPAAMRIVTRALREDPGYRIAWVADIAMSFKDHFPKTSVGELARVWPDSLHKVANEAAEAFVALLCKESPAKSEAPQDERRPCAKCGTLRPEAEGSAVFTTCEGPGYNCDGTPEGQPEVKVEPPAPAPSATPALEVLLDDFEDTGTLPKSLCARVRASYASDLASATKALQEEVADLQREDDEWAQSFTAACDARDEARAKLAEAERERDEWRGMADRVEKAHRKHVADLAALRASKTSGLPVDDELVQTYDGERLGWQNRTVCNARFQVLGQPRWFSKAGEGRAWRRVPGEKGEGER